MACDALGKRASGDVIPPERVSRWNIRGGEGWPAQRTKLGAVLRALDTLDWRTVHQIFARLPKRVRNSITIQEISRCLRVLRARGLVEGGRGRSRRWRRLWASKSANRAPACL